MKKKLYAGIVMLLVLILGACGRDTDMADIGAKQEITVRPEEAIEITETAEDIAFGEEAEGEKDKELGSTEEIIGRFLDMLGKTDAGTMAVMEGEQNKAEDGTLIGRIYEVELFGEEVTVGTLYDEGQCVNIITMQLESPDAAVYEDTLAELFGEPGERSDAESETGSTWIAWNKGDKEIRLYQSFGLVSLEFQLLSEAEGGLQAE